jgi:hypothetical protein
MMTPTAALENYIVLVGSVRLADRADDAPTVNVLSVARLETRQPNLGAALPSLVAELLDGSGAVLSAGALARIRNEACFADDGTQPGAAQDIPFQAMLANTARGATLQIRRDTQVLWKVSAPPVEPSISVQGVKLQDDNRTVEATWTSRLQTPPDSKIGSSVWVQWKALHDNEWAALTVGLTGERALLDVLELPRSAPVEFRFLLHDGFSTASAVSAPIDLPSAAPSAAIVQPQSTTLTAGQMLYLLGDVASRTGKSADEIAFTWELDGRPVATTREAWLAPPQPGQHEVVLTVTDSAGSGKASVTIEVQPPSG